MAKQKTHKLIKDALKQTRSKEEMKETFKVVDYALKKMRKQNEK